MTYVGKVGELVLPRTSCNFLQSVKPAVVWGGRIRPQYLMLVVRGN
jgi:hypothetical protein